MLKAFLFLVLLLFIKIFMELFDQSGEWYWALLGFLDLICLFRVASSLNKDIDENAKG